MKLQAATSSGEAGKVSVRQKALDGLDWFLTGDEPPQVKKDDAGLWQPSFLFRGRENWLARLPEGEETKPPVKEIHQEARALVARWLKMQNVCVLVGAGASAHVTKFVTSGLFDRIQTILKGRPSHTTLDSLLLLCSEPTQIGNRLEELLSQVSCFVHLADAKKQPLDRLRQSSQMRTAR